MLAPDGLASVPRGSVVNCILVQPLSQVFSLLISLSGFILVLLCVCCGGLFCVCVADTRMALSCSPGLKDMGLFSLLVAQWGTMDCFQGTQQTESHGQSYHRVLLSLGARSYQALGSVKSRESIMRSMYALNHGWKRV